MIYLKQIAMQMWFAYTYKDSWSGIQGLVQCILTAVITLHYNKLDYFFSIYRPLYLN